MSPSTALLGIALFAVATAILTLWGMRKSYFEHQTLMNMLLSKCSEKVLSYLKTHETITEPEMRKLVAGVSVGEFHSRKRMVAQADKAFTTRLIDAMLHDGLIEAAQKGRQIYRKKK